MFASCLGTFLVMIVCMVLFFAGLSALVTSFDKDVTHMVKVEKNSVLTIPLDKYISERGVSELEMFLGSSKELALNNLLQTIHYAAKDNNIKGIYLKFDMGMDAGWANLEEIRNALLEFKKSKKFIYSYSDTYSQKAYYVASVSDKIYLNPEGLLEWKGLSAEALFFKDMLNKLEVDVELIRPNSNAYKSAGEMFLLNKMSEANRTQIKAYLSGMWQHIIANVSASRNISEEKLNLLADSLSGYLATEAYTSHLVDSSTFESVLFEKIMKQTGHKKISDIPFITFSKYCKQVPVEQKNLKVAVIYAEGDVMSGSGFGSKGVYSDVVVKNLRKAAEDPDVKAIVLRVNSHGGAVIASEIITNEVYRTNAQKPVVASFGDVAASAGYEIAAYSSKIVAQPTTITGSIGVFGVAPNFGGFLKNKLGITFDTVNTNRNSSALSLVRDMSPMERNLLQRNVETFYRTFCKRVAEGRHLTAEFVDSIGRGRVWTGKQAQEIGLVDELGGIDKAVEVAAGLANINDFSIVEYPEKKDNYTQIREWLDMEAKMKLFPSVGKLGQFGLLYESLQKAAEMEGVQARIPYLLSIQ